MKFKIALILLLIFGMCTSTLFSETISAQQVIIEWNKAENRSKHLYNIALHQIQLRKYWVKQSSIRDSLITNLEGINETYKDVVALNEAKFNNLQTINKNLIQQLNNSQKGLGKEWYFGIGLIIGLVPPCAIVILLGGK